MKRKFTKTEVFKNIWTSPKQVFGHIEKDHNDNFYLLLLFLAGVIFSLDKATMTNTGVYTPLLKILPSIVIFGGLGGIFRNVIFGLLLKLTGKLVKGQGSFDSILRVLSYAQIPIIISSVFMVIRISVLGEGHFFISPEEVQATGLFKTIVFYICLIIEILLQLFSIVLAIIALSVVQQISLWNSILNIALVMLLVLVSFGLIGFFLSGYMGWDFNIDFRFLGTIPDKLQSMFTRH